jgi:hypothetical protein
VECLLRPHNILSQLPAEKLHRSFLRHLLKVRKSVPSQVLLAEFGRYPLYFKWKKLVLRYFNKLKGLPDDRVLLRAAFHESIELAKSGKPCWTLYIHQWTHAYIGPGPNVIDTLRIPRASQDEVGNSGDEAVLPCSSAVGASAFVNEQPHTQMHGTRGGRDSNATSGGDTVSSQVVPPMINPEWPDRALNEIFVGKFEAAEYFKFLREPHKHSKIMAYFDMYRRNPGGFYDIGPAKGGPAEYLVLVPHNQKIQITLARFRTSCHYLQVETNRWSQNRPAAGGVSDSTQLSCTFCESHDVEDELHFIFDCPKYDDIRHEFRDRLFTSNQRDLRAMFATAPKVKDFSAYIWKSFQLRSGNS